MSLKLKDKISGKIDSANKLTEAREILVDLESTAPANFDGEENINPGISGVLPIKFGGTGANNKADALDKLGALATGTANGEIININDSADANIIKFGISGKSEQQTQLTGKNLFDINKLTSYTYRDITYTNNNGEVIVSGTTPADGDSSCLIGSIALPAGEYYINGGVNGGSGTTYQMVLYNTATSKESYITDTNDVLITILEESTFDVRIYVYKGITVNDMVFKPMIRKAEITDSAWEPYIGGIPSPNPNYPQEITSVADNGIIEIVACRKNLLKSTIVSQEMNGLVITVNDDGTFIVNGTATTNTFINVGQYNFVANTKYKLTGCPATGTGSTYKLGVYKYGVAHTYVDVDYGSGKILEADENIKYYITMAVYKDTTVNNLVFKPMLTTDLDATYDNFEPYKEIKAVISIPEPLRSLPNGTKDELIVNKDGTGKIIRRVGKRIINIYSDIGTMDNGNKRFVYYINDKFATLDNTPDKHLYSYCDRLIFDNITFGVNTYHETLETLTFVLSPDETLESFKEKMDGAVVLYMLATPIEEELSKEQVTELLKLKTYDNATNIYTTDTLQPELNIEYYKNTNVGSAIVDVINNIDNMGTDFNDGIDEVTGVTGKNIHISDTIDSSVAGLKIYGKSEQGYINGYQLFDASKLENLHLSEYSIYNNGDGSLSISGTTLTSDMYHKYSLEHDEFVKIFKKGTYKINNIQKTNPYFCVWLMDGNNYVTEINSYGNGRDTLEITDEILSNENIKINIGFYGVKGEVIAGTIKPMLYIDGDGEWEPYVGCVASPNPNYPQQTTSINNIKMKSCGVNLFNKNNPCVRTTDSDTISGVLDNGVSVLYKLTGTSNTSAFGIWTVCDAKYLIGKTITMSTRIDFNSVQKTRIGFIIGNKDFKNRHELLYKQITSDPDINNKLYTLSYTISENDIDDDVHYLGIILNATYGACTANGKCNFTQLQVEIGDTNTQYKPYIESSTSITIDNLRSLPNGIKDELVLNPDGTGKIIRRIGEETFNGSSDETWGLSIMYPGSGFTYININNKGIDPLKNVKHIGKPYGYGLCNRYRYHDIYNDLNYPVNTFKIDNNSLSIRPKDTAWGSLDEFRRFLSQYPITIQYELDEPYDEYLSQKQLQQVLSLKTFDKSTTIMIDDNIIETDVEVEYYKNNSVGIGMTTSKDVDNDMIKSTGFDNQCGCRIVDSALNSSIASLYIEGKSVQQTYTGKNLMKLKELSNLRDVYGTIKNTETDSASGWDFVVSDGTTTLFTDTITTTGKYSTSMVIPTDTTKLILTRSGKTNDFSATFDTVEIIKAGTIVTLSFNVTGLDASRTNGFKVKNIQLEKGSIATDYEECMGGYPGPHPNNPQQIKSVGFIKGPKLKATGKNLFGGLPLAQGILNNGSTGTVLNENNKTIRFYYNSNYENYSLRQLYSKFKENTQYSFILNGSVTGGSQTNLCIRYTDDSYDWIDSINKVIVSKPDKSILSFEYNYATNATTTTLNYEKCGIFEGVITLNDFEPYVESTTTLSIDSLKSLPNGVKDELVFNHNGGKIIRRVAEFVIDGSEKWTVNEFHSNCWNLLSQNFKKNIKYKAYGSSICSHYVVKGLTENPDIEYAFSIGANLNIKNMDLTTTDEFLTWLSNNHVTVQCELSTPYEEQLTEEQVAQILNLKTFENVTYISLDEDIQSYTNVNYYTNTVIGEIVSDHTERINKLDDDVLATGSISGSNININDSTNAPINSLTINGKSEQKQYTGKNLLPITLAGLKSINSSSNWSDGTYTFRDVSYTPVFKDGLLEYIEINGTPTAGTLESFFSFSSNEKLPGNLNFDTKYICSLNEEKVDGLIFQIFKKVDAGYNYISITSYKSGIQRVSIPNDGTAYLIRVRVSEGYTFNKFRIYPMMRLTTQLDPTYEPYVGEVPSPNPVYPQKITSVADGGKLNIATSGKNLLNSILQTSTVHGITCTNNGDGSYTFNGTSTDICLYTMVLNQTKIPDEFLPNVKYRFGGINDQIQVSMWEWVNSAWVNINSSRESGNGYFTISENVQGLLIRLDVNKGVTLSNMTITPYIVMADDDDTMFTQYEGCSVSRIDMIEPLRSLPNGIKDELIFNNDGTGKIIRRVGSRVFNGGNNEKWYKNNSDTNSFVYYLKKSENNISTSSIYSNCYCSHLLVSNTNVKENTICKNYESLPNILYINAPSIFDNNSNNNNIDYFKTWLNQNPITFIYDLETPVEELLTNEQLNQLLNLKTYDNITNIYSNDTMQPELCVGYYKNTNIGESISGFRNNLATEEHSGLMSAEDKTRVNLIDELATGNESGEMVPIIDSTYTHISSLTINGKSKQKQYTGKNLINPILDSRASNGITFTKNQDNTYNMSGTLVDGVTDGAYVTIATGTLEAGKYILSGGITEGKHIRLLINSGEGINYFSRGIIDKHFELTDSYTYSVILVVRVGETVSATDIFKPMLRKDTFTDSTYEPYVGGLPSPNPEYPQEINSAADTGSIDVVSCGKNVLKVTAQTTTQDGVKITRHTTGAFTVSGTATANTWFTLAEGITLHEGVTYRLTGLKDMGISMLYIQKGREGYLYQKGNVGVNVTINETSNEYVLVFFAPKGQTYNNLKLRPMISTDLTTTYDDFEEYKETKATFTIDPLRSLPNGTKDELIVNPDGTGKIIRRTSMRVFDGSTDEDWKKQSEYNDVMQISISDMKSSSSSLCSHFQYTDDLYIPDIKAYKIVNFFNIKHPLCTSVTSGRKFLEANNVTLCYELITPTEQELTNVQLNEFMKLYSYENITNIITNDSVRPELNIGYFKNTNVGKICGAMNDRIVRFAQSVDTQYATDNNNTETVEFI